MRTTIRSLALAGLLVGTIVGAGTADAQPNRRRVIVERRQVEALRQRQIGRIVERHVGRRAEMVGRSGDARAIRDRVVARRAVMRERIRNMTPEQRTAFQAQRQALRIERQAIGAQLRAGTITREQAQTRMRAWREQHPNALRRPPRGPGGEF